MEAFFTLQAAGGRCSCRRALAGSWSLKEPHDESLPVTARRLRSLAPQRQQRGKTASLVLVLLLAGGLLPGFAGPFGGAAAQGRLAAGPRQEAGRKLPAGSLFLCQRGCAAAQARPFLCEAAASL